MFLVGLAHPGLGQDQEGMLSTYGFHSWAEPGLHHLIHWDSTIFIS